MARGGSTGPRVPPIDAIAMEDRPDEALVAEALAGRAEAFAVLVRRYQDHAYGAAIGRLSDFELARDVVQEAFLCAYRDLRRLRNPARFGGWLRGIVRNTAHRALRELSRVQALADEMDRSVEPPAPTRPPDESAEQAERREIVRRALARLGEKSREAVSLHYVDGLSYADIAEFLHVTETTVQGRLQRGRAQLRKELTMVEETFKQNELPDDFSQEVQRLLDAADERGRAHQDAIRRLTEIGAPAVDPLCEALADPRIPVRRAAAAALCRIGDARALRPILRALYSDDHWTVNLLRRSGDPLGIPGVREELLQIVREGKGGEHYWAVEMLAFAKGDDEVFDCLCKVFRDTRADNRHGALWALCHIRPEAGTDLVAEALDDPDADLRWRVQWIALRAGILPPIDACLKAFDERVRPSGRHCAAMFVLDHGEEGKQTLGRLLHTGTPEEQATAALGLASTGHAEAFEVLKRELCRESCERAWVRVVSQVLARHYRRELAAWVESEPTSLRGAHTLAWTLARSRPEQASDVVGELCQDGTPAVRHAATRILSRQKRDGFIPDLRRALREGRPRKVAQEAFWQMHRLRDAAMPTVTEMLESEHWTERKAALCLLRRWGRLTPAQRDRARQDPHPAVRHAADWHPRWQNAARWHAKWRQRVGEADPETT